MCIDHCVCLDPQELAHSQPVWVAVETPGRPGTQYVAHPDFPHLPLTVSTPLGAGLTPERESRYPHATPGHPAYPADRPYRLALQVPDPIRG